MTSWAKKFPAPNLQWGIFPKGSKMVTWNQMGIKHYKRFKTSVYVILCCLTKNEKKHQRLPYQDLTPNH